MQQFYSPMPENKGAALFVSVIPNKQNIVFTLVKQTSYDTDNKKGGFAGGKRINVNLSIDETGALIEAIRNKGEVSIFHTYNNVPTAKGRFNYYEINNPAGKPKRGFGLKITKDEVEFKVGFNLGSAERLAEYLKYALTKCFDPDFAADIKKEEEWQKKKQNTPAPTAKPEPEPEPNEESPTAEELDW